MTRSLLALAASAFLAATAVACGAAPESGSNKLPTCDPATDDCPKSSSSHKPGTGSPSTSENDITQTTDPASPAPHATPDAGADAAPDAGPDAAKTTFCQDLLTCCGELEAQGYDSSLCKGVVANNDQTQCLQKLASYQSFGDCKQAQ